MGARDELYGDERRPPHSPAGALQPPRRRARRGAARVGHGPTGEHIGEICPYVPILDVLVPQMGDQVVEVLRKFDVQVIAVPLISFDFVPQRSAVRRPKKAEQLVEVPTEPGYALAVVASKVFSRRELRGILSGQGSTSSGSELCEQTVDNPVPQGRLGGGGGLQGSRARQGSTAADVEQIIDFPARRGLQGFLPGQGSTASSSRTFPRPKKSAEVTRQSSARVPASLSSSELSSHQKSGEDEAGDALSAAYAALRRLRRRERRVEERAEAEAAGGATAQQTVEVPVVDVPMLFSDKFQQSSSSS